MQDAKLLLQINNNNNESESNFTIISENVK